MLNKFDQAWSVGLLVCWFGGGPDHRSYVDGPGSCQNLKQCLGC